MKHLVLTASVFVALLYLSTMPAAAQCAQAQGHGATAGESERTHAESISKVEAAKAGPKTPGVLLAQNKELSDKLSALLRQQNPPVTNLQAASQGFEILGRFVAAVHISHNLGIPFDQLKTQAQTSGGYGKAIPVLRPDADAKAEVKKAAEQAVDDLEESYWVIAQECLMSVGMETRLHCAEGAQPKVSMERMEKR